MMSEDGKTREEAAKEYQPSQITGQLKVSFIHSMMHLPEWQPTKLAHGLEGYVTDVTASSRSGVQRKSSSRPVPFHPMPFLRNGPSKGQDGWS
jgi:hypothetical protein